MAELTPPAAQIVLAHFIVSNDVERSRRFYAEVLGGTVVFSGEPTYVALSNSWRRRAISTGSAASSISGSQTLRPCTPNGAAGALNS
jgi:hypothetical protein